MPLFSETKGTAPAKKSLHTDPHELAKRQEIVLKRVTRKTRKNGKKIQQFYLFVHTSGWWAIVNYALIPRAEGKIEVSFSHFVALFPHSSRPSDRASTSSRSICVRNRSENSRSALSLSLFISRHRVGFT